MPLFLSALLSACSTRPNPPEGTYVIELRSAERESAPPIFLCVPETTVQPVTRVLNGGNSVTLVDHALMWSEGERPALLLVTTEEAPPRILSNGVSHPDDRLDMMLSVADVAAGYVPPAEDFDQTDANKVVDLVGDEFDLYRESTSGAVSEVLRPRGGMWRGSRLAISCSIDPRIIAHFSGASICQWDFHSGDFMYSVTTGRAWLQHWPDVATAVQGAIARYRERCR